MSGAEKKTCPERDRYLIDEKNLVWYTPNDSKPVLAVPRSMVPELLALVHTLHGHAGVGATLALVRSHFHWPTIARDTRLYVASCGSNRRKRSRSQKIATMPGRAVEPWETLEVDILSMGTTSRTGNKHILLAVDRASRFPFAFPLPSKGTKEVARILANVCLTYGVPRNFRSDGGGEFRSEILKSLCHWLKDRLDFGPADHCRGQGAVERFGGWLQEMLAELCKAWPDRWVEYVAPACWIKRTLPDSSLQSKMTAFELLFGRKPRTSLDSLVPLLDGAAQTTSLDDFVEQRKQNLLEVRKALEQRQAIRTASRERVNATINRSSTGVTAEVGDLVLVREADSNRSREGYGTKLHHDKYTGPWSITRVLMTGLSVEVELRGRKTRKRTVATSALKPFTVRPPDLRHTIEDEFAQYAWEADYSNPPSDTARPPIPLLRTLVERRETTAPTGARRWEYKGRFQDGTLSTWLPESQVLQSFPPLQLDVFHALWNLYRAVPSQKTVPTNSRRGLSRTEALKLYPIGTRFHKMFGTERVTGQVFDYHAPYWRVRHPNQDWEELSRSELTKGIRGQ